MPVICSPRIQQYFDSLNAEVNRIRDVASAARAKNLDPETHVDIPLAASVAQRAEALVASLVPQILNSGVAERITELEKQYSPGDWRVALVIGAEVAEGKFCKFANTKDAIEAGTRVGFAYITNGVTSAPLEGLVEIKLKKRRDGQNYVALYFAGPIRNSGGTAATCSILIADYIRRQFEIPDYDITDEEVKRYQVEIDDYVTKIAHRQYVPTAQEIEMIVRSIKLEITGDPTEKYEVSQCKHLDRVETDFIRGGMALVMTEGPSLKAEKLWKQLSKWGKEFKLDNWFWLEDFIALKTKLHTKAESGKEKTQPINTYLTDIVAGRPVFAYPMRKGGFRLRYGRSRLSGFAATAIHPATMQVLDDYVATGTQLKTERPGKATVVSVCDSIEGPVVKLEDGSVVRLTDEAEARKIRSKISEIIFIGDLLVTYGDFSENGQRLVNCGYCEEWWEQDAEKAAGKKIPHPTNAPDAIRISEQFSVPLHPKYTYHWKDISQAEFAKLFEWFRKLQENFLPLEPEAKLVLESIGCPHTVADNKVIFDVNDVFVLKYLLRSATFSGENGMECINSISNVKVRDKSGTFIGARMGRPEKAKMRKLKGSPVVLFPVGREGGRLRSFQEALSKESVFSDFPIYSCESCNSMTIYPSCENCGKKTEQWRICRLCKKKTKQAKCHTETVAYERRKLDITKYFDAALKYLGTPTPPLVKGVRGTWNKDHITENLAKGILRARNNLTVNKDGTIRYDMTEMGTTHFRAKEIGVSVEKLKELGYEKDKDGNPLENEEQVIEIFPQDVILPSCPEAVEEGADKVLIRVCNFIDELLEKFYKLPKFYNVKTRDDLIGQIVIGLAPHTSCGTIGRVIGFSKTQGCFAHPYWHAAQRRNFDGDETCVILLMDAFLNFSRQFLPDRRGGRSMDAPLVLTTILIPEEVDTEVHGLDIVDRYPLEFYEAAAENKMPWEVKIEQIKNRLGKPEQYENMKYTNETSDMNAGVVYSAYKLIPTMVEKMEGQLLLAKKLRAVNLEEVAKLVVEKHFIRDIKGNLRGFTSQEFRCVSCNNKYRRTPLSGTCTCGGKLIFTISEGNIKKYLEVSMKLVAMDNIPPYLQQAMEILKRRIESIFGKDLTKQIELKSWFGEK